MTRGRGWDGVLRWGRLPAAACLLAGAGLVAGSGAAGADSFTPGAWSGYVLKSGSYWWVNATFTVPTGSCTQGPGESGPGTSDWVGIQGSIGGNAAIIQTGFIVECEGGQPTYTGWHADMTGTPTTTPEPMQPGDQVVAAVVCSGSTCTQELQDVTQNWTDNLPVSVPDGWTGDVAAVASESQAGGISTGPVPVTLVTVNWNALGQYSPEADEQVPGNFNGTASVDPSPIDASGMNFDFAWNGNPGS